MLQLTTDTDMPLPKPDLTNLGVSAWARIRIFEAISEEFSEDERSLHVADASICHCGRCSRYPRCKFSQPRCVADVAHNIRSTGSKAAGRIAKVGTIVDHFGSDVVISFGIGAGTCVAGWTLARGADVGSLFGVEIEPIATRVARAAFPHAKIAPRIEQLDIPFEGRLIAITSLVMNCVDCETARSWATRCTQQAEDLLWINVGRLDEPGAFHAFRDQLTHHGLHASDLPLPPIVDRYDTGYITSAAWWRR